MKRIGIYGGSFNPPHLGHMRAAQWAVEVLGLSKMLVIPCNISPGKPVFDGGAQNCQRLEMLQLATVDCPQLTLCTLELERGDTILQLRCEYPDDELILCMGSDAFQHFEQWKDIKTIIENASIAVFHRGKRSDDTDQLKEK